MGDENPIRTLGDYSKPSHKGYRNTIELPTGNNVDPNQHLKDFLKLVDSLDLDGENGERMRLRLFQLSLRNQASNWLERLPAGSITTWEDLTTNLIFYDHVSFHLKCEIDHAADGKLHNKNADESWEIIENLTLYDHEGRNDTKQFVKLVKAISTPQSTSKTPDRRLLELEDQINFLLKGSRTTPRPSSTHVPQAYAEVVYSNPFTFRERTGPNPQPQALGTTFEARVRDYMAAHTERMERYENAIFKQREEINNRMTKMFGLLKELLTSRTPKKVLIREEAKFPVTKNVNSISLVRGEEEGNDKIDIATGYDIEKPTGTEMGMQVKEAEKKNEAGKEEMTEVPSSQPV
ncbi:hypothetical protein Tco_1258898, partial [Tanacetum coccineum]